MKNISIFLLAALALAGGCLEAAAAAVESLPTYQRLAKVRGVRRASLSLNGEWDFRMTAQSSWTRLAVPGEAAMQGYAIRHDVPFYYRRTVTVPKDFAGQRVVLRFEGVYSHARLSVNGQFVRQHDGGFTRWDTDITRYVTPGQSCEIALEVTDPLDDVSYASGYAHHPIGGILRNVSLLAVPRQSLTDVAVFTDFDQAYRNATLRFACNLEDPAGSDEVQLTLIDPRGKKVFSRQRHTLNGGANEWSTPVTAPMQWDAEHPNLYTLEVVQLSQGREVARFAMPFGFREVRVDGDRLLVNGKQVKLRGACRHDVSANLGRSTTAELDSLDVILFKEANMNFVRTSHYPPSEAFVRYCDRYDIYIECETAACFVDTYRQRNYAPGASESNPAYRDRHVGQAAEMVKAFRSNPSVLFWSVGNESIYGDNFRASYDVMRRLDPSRPTIFSYPGTVKGEPIYQLLSMHYPGVDGNMSQYNLSTRNFAGEGIPALFDEWAHPACYTYSTLQEDPGIREFWGKSLDLMWQGVWRSRGALGGAIWGYVDDIFYLPEPKEGTAWWKEFAHTAKPIDYEGRCVGYGQWGIVDVWRRKKPEFWGTKKAYTPVSLLLSRVVDSTDVARGLKLTVANRYDHTNLSEIQAFVECGGKRVRLALPALAPHDTGSVVLPARQLKRGSKLRVEFIDAHKQLIDSYEASVGAEHVAWPAKLASHTLRVDETASHVIVRGEDFAIPFNRTTGLIEGAEAGGGRLIDRGPYLNLRINYNHLTGAEVRKMSSSYTAREADWRLTNLDYMRGLNGLEVTVEGTYGTANVTYHYYINADGSVRLSYSVEGVPNGYLKEDGLRFYLPSTLTNLSWQRRGYWTSYPAADFEGNCGSTPLTGRANTYGQCPDQPWYDDTHDYYYWSDAGAHCANPLRQTAKGMKENIYYYTVSTAAKDHALSVVSPTASLACRLNKTPGDALFLNANSRWDYPEIAWGNWCKVLEALPVRGTINLQLR